MARSMFAVWIILLLAAGRLGAQALELDVSDSALGRTPGANGYTSIDYEGCPCGGTIQIPFMGPRPQRMPAAEIRYFLNPIFGVYASYGGTRTSRAEVSNDNGVTVPSIGTAYRSLSMFNAGALFSMPSGFLRPYGYAGVGRLRDNYAWSTIAVTQEIAGFYPPITSTQSGKTTSPYANFQFGGGLRFYPRRWVGVRVFGEIDLQPAGLLLSPLPDNQGNTPSSDFFVRAGIGLFIRPFGH